VSEARGSERARVFFALWPEPEVQAGLHQRGSELHRRLGGKLTRRESVHLTLAFLGDVPVARVPVLAASAERIAFEPFTMRVDTAGCWNHNHVGWLSPSVVPPPLALLAARLESELRQLGFELDERPYAPHITVVRKARCRPLDAAIAPVEWRVEAFVLVQSELNTEGSRYSVIGRWGAKS
jgi:RNA 2',3'-cyclic 3'-phosphodiesterase